MQRLGHACPAGAIQSAGSRTAAPAAGRTFLKNGTSRTSAPSAVRVGAGGIAGGDDVPRAGHPELGKDRIIADGAEMVRRNPDIVIGSWCGKKFRPKRWRRGLAGCDECGVSTASCLKSSPPTSRTARLALTDGVEQLQRIMVDWAEPCMST